MKKIIKEPLLHFLILGTLLFLIYGLIYTEQNDNEITVDDALINELVAKWEVKRNRRPSLQEVEGMVELYIEQELLYREALAMNLDHNDEIVKRRLAQKMEFISDGLAETLQPTEKMLQTYYQNHQDFYEKTSRYTMRLVYFNGDKRGSAFEDANNALKAENPMGLGDQFSLSTQYTKESVSNIAREYGSTFASTLETVQTGEWTGPIHSPFGVHLVHISERIPAGHFSFNEVAEKVRIDYNYEASIDFKKGLIASLLKNYHINISITNVDLKKELDEIF